MTSHLMTRDELIVILLAAVATYALRIGGLLLASRLPQTGRFKRFMDALPGTILLSLVAPGALAAGPWGVVAAVATAVCTWKTGQVFLAMLLGVAIVAVQRQFGG